MIESSPYIGVALQRNPELILRPLGFTADPWQRRVLRSKSDILMFMCHRQWGKSWTAAGVALNTAIIQDDSLIIVISASQRQSDELFSKICKLYRLNGTPIPIVKQNSTTLMIDNGSRIVSLPDSPDTVVGFSAPRMVLIDEASRVSNEAFIAVKPMLLSSRGRLVILTTPHGRIGWFYDAWHNDKLVCDRIMVRASENPRIDPEYLKSERMIMGDLWCDQEYECKFVDIEDQVFSSSIIDSAFSSIESPLFSA